MLKRRAGRLIWLNPLLGNADYAPVTRGMQAALPFINVFAPAHDLAEPARSRTAPGFMKHKNHNGSALILCFLCLFVANIFAPFCG